MKTQNLLLTVLALVIYVTSQPIPKTGWRTISERPASLRSYPRVASFSNGDYAVVYGVNDTNSSIAMKIFYPDGSVKVPETIISSSIGVNYAPNIMVVGDMAIAVWRNSGSVAVQSSHFYSNGSLVATYNTDSRGTLNTEDFLGLFSMNSTLMYGVTIPPTEAGSPVILFRLIGTPLVTTPYYNARVVDIPSVIFDPRSNASFYFETMVNETRVTKYTGSMASPLQLAGASSLPISKYFPFLIDSLQVLPVVAHDGNGIRIVVLNQASSSMRFQRDLFNATPGIQIRPDVLFLGLNYALVAHTSSNSTLEYRYVRVNDKSVDFIGPSMADTPGTSSGVSMAKVGNDIVVTAYNAERTQVMTRVLTFCGNGVLDFNEECDKSQGCDAQCMCQLGTSTRNGFCADSCGNGIVTGDEDCDSSEGCDPITCKCQAGYLPDVLQKQCRAAPVDFVPKVGPSLDCLTSATDTLQLFFSFVSTDQFDQTIEYGVMNNFVPSNIATNRPTFFKSGTTLTYPVSPYNLTIPRSISQFTWLLGSYNLTVDLSGDKSEALQCPKNAGFVLTVTTFDILNDVDVQLLLVNMASKYNISIDRLEATYHLSAAGTATEPNIYAVSITILSSTNPQDTNAQDVLKELYSDLVDTKDELVSDLTRGLEEKNPQIKEVTPLPTGVEVRGQERDIDPVFVPPNAASTASSIFASLCLALCMLISGLF